MFPSSLREAPVSIVTVSYGSGAVLEKFLRSVPAATVHPCAVVVADNKPDEPNTVMEVVERARATYLPMPHNLGYGGAINASVQSTDPRSEWILISNPDVVLHPGSIDTMLNAALEDPFIGAVGPAIYSLDGAIYPSARSLPSLRTGVGHALFVNLWTANPWSRAYRIDNLASDRRDAGWLSGACLLVRRSAFESVGGFDPSYFMYFEDVDLGYRLGKRGFRNVYEPAAAVTHLGAHATRVDSRAMISAHHRSAEQFVSRKYPGKIFTPLRAVVSFGLRVRSALLQRRAQRHSP